MRLKLAGPDYKGKDPTKSLEDFKKRVAAYKTAYVSLGRHEEDNDMPYIQVRHSGFQRYISAQMLICDR